MLHSRGWTGAQGGAVRWVASASTEQLSNTTLSSGSPFARGDLVCVAALNEPFQRAPGGLGVM